ncbi:hypothetical protein CYMTET_31376, partial [Cymbomonas tetramitiformis]|eukprot:gene21187-25452_t
MVALLSCSTEHIKTVLGATDIFTIVRDEFNFLDRNSDGCITMEELVAVRMTLLASARTTSHRAAQEPGHIHSNDMYGMFDMDGMELISQRSDFEHINEGTGAGAHRHVIKQRSSRQRVSPARSTVFSSLGYATSRLSGFQANNQGHTSTQSQKHQPEASNVETLRRFLQTTGDEDGVNASLQTPPPALSTPLLPSPASSSTPQPNPPLQIDDSVTHISDAAYAEAHLAAAIDHPDVATIVLHTSVILSAPLPDIQRHLVIRASCLSSQAGCEIDGGGLVRILAVAENGTLEAYGLVLKNGYSAADGSGLHIADGSAVYLRDCTIRSCKGARGAAVYAGVAADLTLEKTSIVNNTASNAGGGVFGDAGSHLKVLTGTIVSFNSAVVGGGLYGRGQARVTVAGMSVVSANVAKTGAGIYQASVGSIVTVANHSRIGSNVAEEDGAGLWSLGDVKLTGQSTVNANVAGNNGGGLWHLGYLTVELSSAISDNMAGGFGGGSFCSAECTIVVANRSGYARNTAEQCGGIFAREASSVLLDNMSSIHDNVVDGSGGGACILPTTTNTRGSNMTVSAGSGIAGNIAVY